MAEKNKPGILNTQVQYRDGECALVCLKLVSYHYSKNVSVQYLEEIIKMDPSGVSIYDLVKALNVLNFKSLVLNGKYAEFLAHATMPCIYLSGSNHYMVIYEVSDQLVTYADQINGVKKITFDDFFDTKGNSDTDSWIIIIEPEIKILC